MKRRRGKAEFVAAFVSIPGAVFLISGPWFALFVLGLGGLIWVSR